MSKKHNFFLGTILLTATSFVSRFIGFFFRIFLSHTFGEEQLGIYQLIFPIYALCFSFTSAGIEIALSRNVAKEVSLGKKDRAICYLYVSLSVSVLLSLFTMRIIQANAVYLSIYILGDLRCETMISTIVYALPFASVHSCICGYYLGLKQAKITAYSQFIEQTARVGSVFLFFYILSKQGDFIQILYAVYGIVISEIFASFFCLRYYTKDHKKMLPLNHIFHFPHFSKNLLRLAIPITSNRVLTNLLQSMESISIPLSLQKYGYTTAESLSTFGVLTGMVLPCLLFPSAITNSIATLILPTVTEIQTSQNYEKLRNMIQKVITVCVLLGLCSGILFFIFSNLIGIIFGSPITASYLKVLCWICPFLYTNTTLASITNGLEKTNITFSINCLGLLIRIFSILIVIPYLGINGYLWGLLLSQILSFFLYLIFLFHFLEHHQIKNRGC